MGKMPALRVKDLNIGCPHCSTASFRVKMSRPLYWMDDFITRNGHIVDFGMAKEPWADDFSIPAAKTITLMTVENFARRLADSDWRYEHVSAMHSTVFQRHGKNKWICIESGPGYA